MIGIPHIHRDMGRVDLLICPSKLISPCPSCMELRGPWTFAPAKSRGRAENAEPGAGVIGQLCARDEPHHRHRFHQVLKK